MGGRAVATTYKQLALDLDARGARLAEAARQRHAYRKWQAMCRAVIRWLDREHQPTAMATVVPTRVSRHFADVAAFWSRPRRNPHDGGPARLLAPERTVIVECYTDRRACWPDCTRSAELLPYLRSLKEQLAAIEAEIRSKEPQLRENAALFEEYAEWHYERSANKQYHHLRREIDKTEHALYHGTKFDRIRSAQLADVLYLAVPERLVTPDELADGWGLLWVSPTLEVTEVGPPHPRECTPQHRLHLVQNIAAAATDSVRMEHGVRRLQDEVVFVTMSRRHRKPVPGHMP
jgi:hypothetical protein